MTKPTGDSFDDLTAELLDGAENYAHNIAHGTADRIGAAGFVRMLAAHLRETDDKRRSVGLQLDRLSRGVNGAATIAPAAPRAEHRHKFDAAGKCTLPGCVHVKGRGGRPRNQPADPASEALPSVVEPGYRAPAPRLAGDAAADRFLAGGAGGSTGRP